VVELLNNNFEVVIIDDLSNSEKFILKNIEEISGKKPIFYPFDLKRKELLKQVFDAHKIEGCIHFAAYKAVGESQEKPIDYYENNLFSLINLLQEFKERNISNFIFSSSCTVYGQADKMPIDEETVKITRIFLRKNQTNGRRNFERFCNCSSEKSDFVEVF
jgi:UDP-glucose 4-epimerase